MLRAPLLVALFAFGQVDADPRYHASPPPDCVLAPAQGQAASIPVCPASAASTANVNPVLAQPGWLAPLGSGPRGPAAGSLLAGVCLAWLALLMVATVVRPRGWHHKPLFPGLRRRP